MTIPSVEVELDRALARAKAAELAYAQAQAQIAKCSCQPASGVDGTPAWAQLALAAKDAEIALLRQQLQDKTQADEKRKERINCFWEQHLNSLKGMFRFLRRRKLVDPARLDHWELVAIVRKEGIRDA